MYTEVSKEVVARPFDNFRDLLEAVETTPNPVVDIYQGTTDLHFKHIYSNDEGFLDTEGLSPAQLDALSNLL